MMEFLARMRKALVAGAGAGFAAFLKGHETEADWIMIVGSAAVVGFVTYWMPNKPAEMRG